MAHTLRKPPTLILLFLFSFSNFLGLMYSAALPDLTAYFGVEKWAAQQTIVLFLFGFGVGQLIYGPLSSAIGRKNAIYSGCTMAIVGSLLCVLSIKMDLFSLLLLGRFVTALGSACSLSMTFTMISDAFTHAEGKKKLSVLIGGFAFFPAMGIFIGGLLTNYLGWQYCFYFMLGYAAFVLALCSLLPETSKEKDIGHLHPIRILKTYFHQFHHFIFLFCSVILGIASGIVYIFAAEAPFIAIDQLHLSADLFGLLNLVPFLGLFLGGFFSSYISDKYPPKTLILLGSLVYTIFSFSMLTTFLLGMVNVNTLFLFPFVIFFSFPMIFSSSSLLGLSGSPNKAYASSLINFLQIMIAVVIMETIFAFPTTKATVLPLIYSAIGVVLLILWAILKVLPTKEE